MWHGIEGHPPLPPYSPTLSRAHYSPLPVRVHMQPGIGINGSAKRNWLRQQDKEIFSLDGLLAKRSLKLADPMDRSVVCRAITLYIMHTHTHAHAHARTHFSRMHARWMHQTQHTTKTRDQALKHHANDAMPTPLHVVGIRQLASSTRPGCHAHYER